MKHTLAGRCGLVAALVVAGTSLTACKNDKRNAAPAAPDKPIQYDLKYELCRTGLPAEGNWKCDPALADVNGDGRLDLAAHVRLGEGPKVWFAGDAGAWLSASEGLTLGAQLPCGGGVEFGDVNNDGHLDLVVADHCQGVFVYLGDGAGDWTVGVAELYPAEIVPERGDHGLFTGAEDLALGDVNGDGNLDIAAGASDNGGGISIYLGDGTGTNWYLARTPMPNEGWAPRVSLLDINNDGHIDLIATHKEGPHVWLGDGTGHWTSASVGLPRPQYSNYNGLAVGDVNGDGLGDLVVANWYDGPEVYLQQPDGTWKQTPDVFPELMGGAYGVAVGDMNGDGHPDIVMSGRMTRDVGYVYGVFVLLGDGGNSWKVARTTLPTGGLPFTWGIALGDLNGDGLLDIVAGSGGIVASSLEHGKPVIDAGMLVWCSVPGD